MEAGVEAECSDRTILRAIGQRDWRRCLACRRSFVDSKSAERRVREAKESLHRRPHGEDWRDIRFSAEFHVSAGASGRIWILRKPGERYCPDYVWERPKKEEDRLSAHFWAAVGYDFKSNLIEYSVPSNTNGKMTQKIYRDQILEKHVKPWLEEGSSFILEEDGDSGHGPKGENIVKKWKQKHGLKHYFNRAGSPDWVPIEKVWRAPKGSVKDSMCLNQSDLGEACVAGWETLAQSTINSWVSQIPQILQETIELEGKMTGY
jgi:hypothetical protein